MSVLAELKFGNVSEALFLAERALAESVLAESVLAESVLAESVGNR